MKHWLKTLQNQALHHVTDIFKKVKIETLKVKIYTSLLHVYLNKLQNQTMLRSWNNNRTQKTQWTCKIICAHLIASNKFISCSLIFKRIMFLNIAIYKKTKIQFKHRWFNLITLILMYKYVITQFHKS